MRNSFESCLWLPFYSTIEATMRLLFSWQGEVVLDIQKASFIPRIGEQVQIPERPESHIDQIAGRVTEVT